jgi:hypothetical protein
MLDEETKAYQNEVLRLLRESNAIMKANHTILENLSENIRKIRKKHACCNRPPPALDQRSFAKKNLSRLVALASFRLGVLFAARPLGAISMSLGDVALAWHIRSDRMIRVLYILWRTGKPML